MNATTATPATPLENVADILVRDIATAETAGELMDRYPPTTQADASLAEAARLMNRHQSRFLLVTGEDGSFSAWSPRGTCCGLASGTRCSTARPRGPASEEPRSVPR